ncbi:MAG: DUF348 domain-containing protein [Anaerolineae bacterium]|nr:DUF348 domain-containing protein [Anaerolineae bacterium]
MKLCRRLIASILALVSLGALVAGYRATLTRVTVVVDDEVRNVGTHQPTVGLLLADLNINLRPEDKITPDIETALLPGTEVRIVRARPVIIRVDGREHLVYAHQESPADLLACFDVQLDSHDSLEVRAPLTSDPPDTRFRIVVERAAEVVLEEGAVRTAFFTTAPTVGAALLQAGIQLYRADSLFPGVATPIQHGMHIRLERSVPVSVHVDGHVLRTRTHRSRVGEVLADLGVMLNGQDYTEPSLDAVLGNGVEVYVVRVSESVIVQQSPIPFDSVWEPDSDWEIDNQRLLQEGEPGVLESRIRVRYENGQVVDRWEEGTSVVKAPVNRVMGYGTKVVIRTIPTENGVVEYWRVLRMLATSYSAATSGVSPSNPYYGRTATGMTMQRGIVAVDPSVIPLHSKIYVPGYGIGIAGDTGGAVRGKRIDLGYDDHNLEMWFAWVDVYMLTPVPANINYLGP